MNNIEQHIIETEHHYVRNAQSSDKYFMYELMNSSSWLKYIGDRSINTILDASRYIESMLISSYKELGYGMYVIVQKSNRQAIGLIGYIKRPYLEYPDLGFGILPAHEGNGIMTRVAQKILEYGMKVLKFDVILAITTLGNIGSKRVLAKCGFEACGTVHDPITNKEYLRFIKRKVS